jgi:hypothetical protein
MCKTICLSAEITYKLMLENAVLWLVDYEFCYETTGQSQTPVQFCDGWN